MILPKTVKIAGISYQVRRNKRLAGGYFSPKNQIISIGGRDKKNDREFGTFVHEIAEASLTEHRRRYFNSNDEPFFPMSHQDLENMCNDISANLFPMIK